MLKLECMVMQGPEGKENETKHSLHERRILVLCGKRKNSANSCGASSVAYERNKYCSAFFSSCSSRHERLFPSNEATIKIPARHLPLLASYTSHQNFVLILAFLPL